MMDARAIGYGLSTGVVSLAMLGGGAGKLVRAEQAVQNVVGLGYPTYVLTILGVWYVAAAVVIAEPRWVVLKEWAYAGIVFAMTGACASQLYAGNGLVAAAPSLAVLCIAIASYVLRPPHQRPMASR